MSLAHQVLVAGFAETSPYPFGKMDRILAHVLVTRETFCAGVIFSITCSFMSPAHEVRALEPGIAWLKLLTANLTGPFIPVADQETEYLVFFCDLYSQAAILRPAHRLHNGKLPGIMAGRLLSVVASIPQRER